MKKAGKSTRFLVLLLLTGLLTLSLFMVLPHDVAAQDSDNDGVPDLKENDLASMYAPCMHFASGEFFFPTTVSYHVDNSVLKLKLDGGDNVIDNSPTIASIANYPTGDYFLDNKLGGFQEIANDYTSKKISLGYIIYARVTKDDNNIIVQYWFFYAYNNAALNMHEGDWEMIEIILDATETPTFAVYSQHFAGEKALWSDVEKLDQTHPRIYAGLGSHANYFRPYQGKIGLENDVLGTAITLQPIDFQIVLLGERGAGNHPASQDWLEYGGRWGGWVNMADTWRGTAGPKGPGQGENYDKWFSPTSWGMGLFLVNSTWFMLSWIMFYFLYIFLAILVAVTVFKVWRIWKRKKQGKLGFKAAMRTNARIGIILGIVGIAIYAVAIFLPWYVVRGNIQTGEIQTPGETNLLVLDGVNGLQVNMLDGKTGLTQLFGLTIPLGIILFSSVLLGLLDLVGFEKVKSLSTKQILSAISSLIPVILLIIFVAELAALIPMFASAMGGGVTMPPQLNDISARISSSPINGAYSGTIDTTGSLNVWWGLGIGSYLFIVAAAVKIAAGIVLRKTAPKPVAPPPAPAPTPVLPPPPPPPPPPPTA